MKKQRNSRQIPVAFMVELVRKLLSGDKTHTRRIITNIWRDVEPGDMMWVKEKYALQTVHRSNYGQHTSAIYAADDPQDGFEGASKDGSIFRTGWKTPRFMEKCYSRITLVLNEVREEPLNSISHNDVLAEGCDVFPNAPGGPCYAFPGTGYHESGLCHSATDVAFSQVWDKLHKKEGETWADNPTVKVLVFDVFRCNVMQFLNMKGEEREQFRIKPSQTAPNTAA